MSRNLDRSGALFARAQRYIAGGVSSDARRVPGTPLYVDHAAGAYLWDVDGNRYIDYVLGQGPAILGHSPSVVVDAVVEQARRGIVYSAQHEAEVEVAEQICAMVPGAEQVRFNTVGSEAVHAALRLARGYTGRTKMLKFEGHYHGWFDPVLYSVHPSISDAGSSTAPSVVAGTAGQQLSTAGDVIVRPWNDVAAVEEVFAAHGDDIATIITEPVLCNSGAIAPRPGYLQALVDIAHAHGALVVFDEIITGFRIAPGGASEYFGVTPDLATFGKAVAGGMQLSALAGRAEVMDAIARGDVAHAGTFNSHPVAIAAARATLGYLDRNRAEVYERLTSLGQRLMAAMTKAAEELGEPLLVDGPGPVFQTYFTAQPEVHDYRDFAQTDRAANLRMQALLAEQGVNVNSRGLWFMSSAHSESDIDETADSFRTALQQLRR